MSTLKLLFPKSAWRSVRKTKTKHSCYYQTDNSSKMLYDTASGSECWAGWANWQQISGASFVSPAATEHYGMTEKGPSGKQGMMGRKERKA